MRNILKEKCLIPLTFAALLLVALMAPMSANANSKADAIELKAGDTKTAVISEENGTWFYKFTLTTPSEVTFNMNAHTIQYYYINVLDDSANLYRKNPYYDSTMGANFSTHTLDLKAGVYYVSIEKEWTYYGNVDMEFSVKASGETFAESYSNNNDTWAKASKAALNSDYVGQIALNDGYDYYSFTINEAGRILLDFDFGNISRAGVTVGRLDATGKMQKEREYEPSYRSDYGSNRMQENVDLTAGTYMYGFPEAIQIRAIPEHISSGLIMNLPKKALMRAETEAITHFLQHQRSI